MKSLSLFFLLLPSVLFSQNKNIVDSLQNELTKAMQDTTKVLILKKLAWQYFHSDPAKSHHYVSRMIEVSEKKKFLKGIWDGYNILGALYKSKTNYDSAIMWFNKALALSEDEKYNDARFYTLKYLGRSYLESADFEKSKYCFSTLLEAASSLGNKKEMARGHKGLAATYYKHGEYYQGLKHYLQADSILGDEISIDHGEILQNIGIVYHAIDNFKLEKEYYKRALSVYEKLNDSYGKNAIEYSLGRLEIENENYLKAERHLLTALTYFEQINEPRILGDIQHSLGKVYYFVEDYSRSIRHQQIAIDIVKRIEGSPSLNQSYRALGESYLALKDYQKAIRAFNKAYAHAIKIGEIQSISLILYSLSDLYSKTGDYEKAYEIQQEYLYLFTICGPYHLLSPDPFLLPHSAI